MTSAASPSGVSSAPSERTAFFPNAGLNAAVSAISSGVSTFAAICKVSAEDISASVRPATGRSRENPASIPAWTVSSGAGTGSAALRPVSATSYPVQLQAA